MRRVMGGLAPDELCKLDPYRRGTLAQRNAALEVFGLERKTSSFTSQPLQLVFLELGESRLVMVG